ncbi:Retrovirus-related Pol polyprotein from transposon RE1 [Vitis vinifera]|uniref:Retrovirus-related Pol polyprotein from transposon RE1 n=1 Tax=Vitis vinifera TaxID=29760 RepID=A0A438GG46_VITVI|nr:Retrovirus-related Pol polyprotein from transposon RE1 [Vitis vinifera]
MVVEESIHVIFDESNNSLQERESVDDDLGLESSMGKLQIEDKRQQEESGEDPKKEDSPLALPPPQQVQGESSQDSQKIGSLSSTIHKIKSLVIHQVGCMHSEFEMSMMGELNFFLGLQIKQLKEGTFINQAKYIKDLLKRFNMEEAKVMKTPMSSSIKLDMDEKGKSIDSTMYRGMIGSLLYLTASRPDIMYSVCLCARFQSCPKESHLSAVKRILRYLKGTMNIGLWTLTCPWHSKKQNSVALSTAEAEYIAADPSSSRPSEISLGYSLDRFEVLECSLTRFKARVSSLDEFGLRILTVHISILDFGWLLERRWVLPELRASALLSPLSQPEQTEARRKARYDTALFGSVEDYQRMGWLPVVTVYEPIFPTLVRAFYSGMTYGLGGPIRTTVRGVEIELSPESICRILDVPPVGLRVYEAKAWPTIPGFEPREVIQRLCGLADAHGMGKPSVHSLTVPSRVLHHMICSILLPPGGHRDESTTRVLPYDRFLTRVFKDAGVDLSRETEFEAPSIYDTYDEHSLGRMKLEKAPDGSWVRKAERQARGHDQLHPGSEGIHVEATFSELMMTEPSFTELPSQAPHAPKHPPWMDLSAQFSSLGTRMEELAVVHDTRFYSVEDRIDQYQAGFTSQFEQLVQRIERLESRQESQHEEMMAYLRSVFHHHLLSLDFVWDPPSFLFYVAKGGDMAKRLIRSRLWPTGSTGWGTGRPVSLVLSRSGRGRHKNLLSLPVVSSSRSSLTPCPVEVRSKSVEATVTCYALNAPTASDPVDPLLVRSRLLSVVFVSRA